jgi:hypothetical protein
MASYVNQAPAVGVRILMTLREFAVGWHGSASERYRARSSTSGASPGYVQQAPVRPALLYIVNLEQPPDDLPPWIRAEQGDACSVPDHPVRPGLLQLGD